MRFDEVILPLSTREFCECYLSRDYLRVSGTAGRFSSLVSWQDINSSIERMRVVGGRIQLVQNGRPVDASSYLHDSGYAMGSTVRTLALERRLREGATLVISQVHELWSRVRALAESCEDIVRVPVGVNLYAGWRHDRAFDLHWDSHDTLILQVFGRKHWQVYAPTRIHPLRDDPGGKPAPPTAPPVWEGILADGDMLYMPQGWWHVARPLDELSLHLTSGFHHPTGLDLLRSLIGELHGQVLLRQPVPHWRSRDALQAHAREVWALARAAMTDEAFDRFISQLDVRAIGRPSMGLPLSATQAPTFDKTKPIRLVEGRCPRIMRQDRESASLAIGSSTMEWQCHAEMVPALMMLHQHRPCTFEQMLAAVPSHRSQALQGLLTAMLMTDVIWMDRTTNEAAVADALALSSTAPGAGM